MAGSKEKKIRLTLRFLVAVSLVIPYIFILIPCLYCLEWLLDGHDEAIETVEWCLDGLIQWITFGKLSLREIQAWL